MQKYRLAVVAFKVWMLSRGLKNGEHIMELMLGVVRAFLAAAGGYIVNKGIADQATVDAIIGALVVIGTSGWSIWSKVKAKKS